MPGMGGNRKKKDMHGKDTECIIHTEVKYLMKTMHGREWNTKIMIYTCTNEEKNKIEWIGQLGDILRDERIVDSESCAETNMMFIE